MADSIQGEQPARSSVTDLIQGDLPAQYRVADPVQEKQVAVAPEGEDSQSSEDEEFMSFEDDDSMSSEGEDESADEDRDEDCICDAISDLCSCCSEDLILQSPSEDALGWLPEDEQTKTYAIGDELPPLPPASRDENDFIRMQYRWGPNDNLVHERAAFTTEPRAMVPPNMTLKKLESRFSRYQSLWLQSCSYRYLRDAVLYQISKGKRNMSKCIIFGSGSPTHSSIDGWTHAIVQIAALKSIADLVERNFGVRPLCYAQEPHYSDLDQKFLLGLGISEVIHPEGFNLVDEETFAFSPYAPWTLERQIMHSRPGLWVHRPIKHYLPESPEAEFIRNGEIIPSDFAFIYMARRVPTGCTDFEDMQNALREIYDDPESGWQTRVRNQVEAGLQMTDNFHKTYEGANLPPCHDRRLRGAFGNETNFRLWATKADKSKAKEDFQCSLRCISNYACGDIQYIPDPQDTDGDLEESEVGSCWIHAFNEHHECGDEAGGVDIDDDDDDDEEAAEEEANDSALFVDASEF